MNKACLKSRQYIYLTVFLPFIILILYTERSRMDEHKPLMESINISINETLSRTILTSTSTLLAVISLLIQT